MQSVRLRDRICSVLYDRVVDRKEEEGAVVDSFVTFGLFGREVVFGGVLSGGREVWLEVELVTSFETQSWRTSWK